MKDISLMSRAELVRELIASTTMTAETAATYVKTRDPAVPGLAMRWFPTSSPWPASYCSVTWPSA